MVWNLTHPMVTRREKKNDLNVEFQAVKVVLQCLYRGWIKWYMVTSHSALLLWLSMSWHFTDDWRWKPKWFTATEQYEWGITALGTLQLTVTARFLRLQSSIFINILTQLQLAQESLITYITTISGFIILLFLWVTLLLR